MNLTFEAARWALVLLIALLLGALGPALDGPSDDEAAADTAADLHAATWRADARSVGCHR